MVPPVGSTSVFIKYELAPQSIVERSPVTEVPFPISKVARPLLFVVDKCSSEYTSVPVEEPERILIFSPTFALARSSSDPSRTTN